jgi:hypothetical protein
MGRVKKGLRGKSAVMANENPTSVSAVTDESLLSKPDANDVVESQVEKLPSGQNGQSETLGLTEEGKVDHSKLSQGDDEDIDDQEAEGDDNHDDECELPETIAESAKDFFTQHSEEGVFYATEDGNFFYERDQHLVKHHAQVSKIRLFVLTREKHG